MKIHQIQNNKKFDPRARRGLTPYPLPLTTKAGFTLFYAVLTASLLLAIGVAIFNITYKELVLSSGGRESTNAFYAADTGLECALYWDLRHGALSGPAFGFYGDSLASGLSGYWRFEDDTGSLVAVDSSGSGNAGTLTSMDANTAWVDGQIDDGIMFDGIDDYVDLTDGATLNFTANQDFSVSLWVSTLDTTGMIFSLRSSTQGNPVVDIAVGSVGTGLNNGMIKALIRDDAGGGYATVNGGIVNNNGWHHVAITRTNGGRLTLYLNGTSQGSNTNTGADGAITTNLKSIGSERRWVQDNFDTPNGRFIAGVVDDVRVYNHALTATEVDQLADLEPNLMFVQPVAEGSFANCVGADITDPATGWDTGGGWDVSTTTTSASTTFDLLLEDNRCATVSVFKNAATTTIISRGYNNCNLNDPRRVERAIRAEY